MRTLCVDLATVFGFAVGDAAGVHAHGSFTLPSTGTDIGAFLRAYRSWLIPALAEWDVGDVVFESPILPGTTNINTCRKLYGLCGVTELLALDDGIDCGEANLMDIREHFIGQRTAPRDVRCVTGCKRKQCGKCKAVRRAWIKENTITRCRHAGFRPADDNDADALALFSYVMTTRVPGFVLAGNEIARAA